MAVFKHEGDTFNGHKVRKSSGVTKKREAEEGERLRIKVLVDVRYSGKVCDTRRG